MINDLSARVKIIQSDLKKLEAQAEENIISGAYDDWKDILKIARHLEALAISRMAVIKYKQSVK